jgi:putative component of membrane protein insertase Oxa1/YidC/SpoIIIJ protein YidD
MRPARALLLAAIRFYRRHVSPRKGFACAYRVHAGGCSCSTLSLRAVSRHGAWRGLGVLRLRLQECYAVAVAMRARGSVVAPRGQAGFIDCGLPCDASCADASCLGDACDLASCLDVGDCGWWGDSRPARARRRRRRGEPVVIEPGPRDSLR